MNAGEAKIPITNRWLVAIIDHYEDGTVTLTGYRREPDSEPIFVIHRVMADKQVAENAARALAQQFGMQEEYIEWQHRGDI